MDLGSKPSPSTKVGASTPPIRQGVSVMWYSSMASQRTKCQSTEPPPSIKSRRIPRSLSARKMRGASDFFGFARNRKTSQHFSKRLRRACEGEPVTIKRRLRPRALKKGHCVENPARSVLKITLTGWALGLRAEALFVATGLITDGRRYILKVEAPMRMASLRRLRRCISR